MALKGTVNIVFSPTVRLGFVLKRELNDQDMYAMYRMLFKAAGRSQNYTFMQQDIQMEC